MKSVFLCLLCISLSCIPTYYGTTINDASYVSRKYSKLKLFITTADGFTDVNYFGNLEDEFGPGDPKTLISNHFFEALKINIPQISVFKEVEYSKARLNTTCKMVTLMLTEEEPLYFNLPVAKVSLNNFTPDFILFFNDTYLGTESNYTNNLVVHSYQKYLVYKSAYVIWDNNNLKVASFGRVECYNPSNIITIEDWLKNDYNFVREILKETPFYIQK